MGCLGVQACLYAAMRDGTEGCIDGHHGLRSRVRVGPHGRQGGGSLDRGGAGFFDVGNGADAPVAPEAFPTRRDGLLPSRCEQLQQQQQQPVPAPSGTGSLAIGSAHHSRPQQAHIPSRRGAYLLCRQEWQRLCARCRQALRRRLPRRPLVRCPWTPTSRGLTVARLRPWQPTGRRWL